MVKTEPKIISPGAPEPVIVRKCGSVGSGAKCLESSIPNDGVFISAWVRRMYLGAHGFI